MINLRRHALDVRSDRTIWSEIRPKVITDIKSGLLQLEQATVPDVKLGVPCETPAERPWTTNIRFVRIGYGAKPVHELAIGSPKGIYVWSKPVTEWAYVADSFSLFPKIHDIPIEDDFRGLYLILVNGQPWFINTPIWMGEPYTNDLDQPPMNGVPYLFISNTCIFHFPAPAMPLTMPELAR